MGSTVQEDVDAANMGIMAKLKKLQKERLIVARLGFPDKAIEIDEHIEKIRADLRVSLFFCVWVTSSTGSDRRACTSAVSVGWVWGLFTADTYIGRFCNVNIAFLLILGRV